MPLTRPGGFPGLFPVNLTDRGFDTSLEELAAYIAKVFHIACTVDREDNAGFAQPFEDNHLATHAYYIVHEAVHNAVKHSCCTTIRIGLAQPCGRIRLSVTDNGCGMTINANSSGMGVRIMSFRASGSGRVSFEPNPSGGTRVILDLPRPDIHPKKGETQWIS